ncbi:hypothetical protein D3C76_1505940 [compost metagenome]
MGHGIRLLAQVEQATGHPAGNIEECQVADLARRVAQALGHLAAKGIENFRVLPRHFAKLVVADFRHFAFGLGADPGAALLITVGRLEQPQFPEEIAVVEVGNDHLMPFVVFDQYGDRALDDE